MKLKYKFLYIEDLGENKKEWIECEACLDKKIRYVHHYIQQEVQYRYCIKCSKKIDNPEDVNLRENGIKIENRLEKNWTNRKWMKTATGNYKLFCKNFEILIYRFKDKFKIKLVTPSKETIWGKKEIDSLEEAKESSWSAFFWAMEHKNIGNN